MKSLFSLTGWENIDILRYNKGTIVKGRYVEPETPSETICIRASVQPIRKHADTQFIPEGERTKPAFVVYSPDYIRQVREGEDGWEADCFVNALDGYTYECIHVEPWIAPRRKLQHYKAIFIRKEIT